jgi:hypothetical protein
VYHPAFFLLWILKEAIVGLLSQLCYECLQKMDELPVKAAAINLITAIPTLAHAM